MEIILKYFSDFTDQQLQQFKAIEELYKGWNSKINVISRKDIDSLYEKHVLHSLSIATIFKFKAGTEILDIGTGGGFPGIPLAIFFPEVRFYLADSMAKKLKVVHAVSLSIGLKNVTILHNRAETIKNKFDFVVSRAVAPLKDLWTWSKPLIKTKSLQPFAGPNPKFHNGLICLKGGDMAIEIQESHTKPQIILIEKIFKEEFFKKKYILYITR